MFKNNPYFLRAVLTITFCSLVLCAFCAWVVLTSPPRVLSLYAFIAVIFFVMSVAIYNAWQVMFGDNQHE